ncbi:thioesterase family protein [Cellulomonas sp. ATA003]|uniref:acyl-CoA thioesterase n=1 Tax=Cellulomonas sp. ATA003 TaxID=3073064 RepID=UPI0028737204|nr:thioesterase family protein [Cellulomonas sp. ATA003]WNB86725.1 thioesterase family protein [Cellulomonas sp. ATA003]
MSRLRVPAQLRWADMDAYGHVNNVQMLQLLEEARIEAFWTHPDPADGGRATAVLDAGPGAPTTTLVARQEIEYLRPLSYRRAPAVVELWIGHLGGASIDVCYEVVDAEPATGLTIGAEPTTTGAPTTAAERLAAAPIEGAAGRPLPAPVPYARACTTLVLVDTSTGRPRRISDAERAAWSPFLGDMITLRRRRPADG